MKRLTIDQLISTIRNLKDQRVVLTFHSMGDTDSVSSAVALAQYMKNAVVAVPDDITSNAARILRNVGFEPNGFERKLDGNAAAVVLLDVNNFEDCGNFSVPLASFTGQITVIDHHVRPSVEGNNVSVMNDESYNSTASIVYDTLKGLGFGVDRNIAQLLLTGIISDSADLKNADYRTFLQIGELLKIAGMDYNEVLKLMQHLADPYGRAKTIEDISRARIEIIDGILVARGGAHSHANIAADLMIKIGADVALFSSVHNSEVSFSLRIRPLFDKKLSIHAGLLMKKLAPKINGTGGGHPCAAGAYGKFINGKADFENSFYEEILRSIKSIKSD